MKLVCLALALIAALLLAAGAWGQVKATNVEDSGAAGVVAGIGLIVGAVDVVIFVLWKLLTT